MIVISVLYSASSPEYYFCSYRSFLSKKLPMFTAWSTAVQELLRSAYGLDAVSVRWERPGDGRFGDVSTAVALQCAREAGAKPHDIAKKIVECLNNMDGIERAEAAVAGYVNVRMTPRALLAGLKDTRTACTAAVKRREPPVIVDYSGPNIAKPLGIHHMLSNVIGQAIVNVFRHLGANVIGWSYPGDWGTQFGKLYVAYGRWGAAKPIAGFTVQDLYELYVRFHAESEKDPSLDPEARAAFARLEAGDPDLRAFWRETVRISRDALERLYERTHIHLDEETGESFYEDKMQPILSEGIERGVFVEGEGGALIAKFPEESGLPPSLFRKGDGSTLYATRDLAMIRYRIDAFHPCDVYYVVDMAQSLHFRQLFAVSARLGWDLPELEHTVFGRMRFKDKSLSTRKGTMLKLEDVLDEAVARAPGGVPARGGSLQTDDAPGLAEMMGVGAVTYGILSQNRKMDMVFDWEKFLSFDGNSAPYLQYTHARARSVLRKAGVQNVQGDGDLPDNAGVFPAKERSLISSLLEFRRVLEEACAARMPH